MIWAVTIPVTAALIAIVARALLRGRRELDRLERAAALTNTTMAAYHAKRSREIARALDELGDDAKYLFPPNVDGHR